MAKKTLHRDLLDIGMAGAFGGISAGIVNDSHLSTPVKGGLGGVIGVAVLSKASKKLELK